ncbi:flagella synthesis protein FlgN [Gammaproteobacteria bacterium]
MLAGHPPFHGLLAAEVEAGERLLTCLEEEHRILGRRQAAPLEAVTQSKRQWVAELEIRVAAHDRFLQDKGLTRGKAGTERLLRSLPNEAPEHDLWRRLQTLATACRTQNEINGRVIELSHRQAKQSIDILLQRHNSPGVYSRRGESCSVSRRQGIIGKA